VGGINLHDSVGHLNGRLSRYNLTLNGETRPYPLYVLDNHAPSFAAHLLDHYNTFVYDPRGYVNCLTRLWNHPDFNTGAGPIQTMAIADTTAAAALICCQYAAGAGMQPSYTQRSLSQWAMSNTLFYERASVMAANIVANHNLPAFGPIPQLRVETIMNYNLYSRLVQLRNKLSLNGVVSENGNGVVSPTDITQAMYLPLFLFFDTFLRAPQWRGCVNTTQLWVGEPQEVNRVMNNIRLYDHPAL